MKTTVLLLLVALVELGCESARHPNRPIPDDFEATLLSGAVLTRADFKGPWVVSLWVPG